jgi:hypothetical protein
MIRSHVSEGGLVCSHDGVTTCWVPWLLRNNNMAATLVLLPLSARSMLAEDLLFNLDLICQLVLGVSS